MKKDLVLGLPFVVYNVLWSVAYNQLIRTSLLYTVLFAIHIVVILSTISLLWKICIAATYRALLIFSILFRSRPALALPCRCCISRQPWQRGPPIGFNSFPQSLSVSSEFACHVTTHAHNIQYSLYLQWLQLTPLNEGWFTWRSILWVSPGMVSLSIHLSINQSINQSKLYSANIPGEARLSGATAQSVFNSKIEETVP